MAEFDPHRIIRKLAEAEWKCYDCSGTGTYPESVSPYDFVRCHKCKETGRIVPFASLRVAACTTVGIHFHNARHYNPSRGKPCDEGWHPEPDVEKACWRIFAEHPKVIVDALAAVSVYGGYEAGKAVLLAAEAWLEAAMGLEKE